jgi:hypothetical protein
MGELQGLFEGALYDAYPGPILPQARDELESLLVGFRNEVEGLATTLAQREGEEFLTPRHVRRAYEILRPVPSRSRRDGQVLIGGLLAGGGVSGIVTILAGTPTTALYVATLAFSVAGTALIGFAFGSRVDGAAPRVRSRQHPANVQTSVAKLGSS